MEKKKFLCLGFNVDKEKGYVTGLAMMHDLFIDILKESNYDVESISLNPRMPNEHDKVGKPSIGRYVEYYSIISKTLIKFITNRNLVFYFNPSTTNTGFYRDVMLVVLAKLLGHNILMQQFGALFEVFKNGLRKNEQRLLSWAYNKSDMIIVEGEYAKSQYSFIRNQEKIRIIQNGLPELNSLVIKEPKTYDTSETFCMFFMNNMIESKGYVDVLKAIDILVNVRKKDVKCTFAGKFMSLHEDEYFKNTNEAKNWFHKFVSDKGLKERVSYKECVFDKDKVDAFYRAHTFLLPSYYIFEGQPTAILEALSYGCVPIVTHYRLIPDMVDDTCGVFVSKKSPDEIADAIEMLMQNPQQYERLSRNGYNRFNDRFTQEVYASRILKVIKEL